MRCSVVMAGLAGIALAGAVAAMASTPFGDDDGGFIPPDSPAGPVTRCENGIANTARKLIRNILKCHIARAVGKLADDVAEDACESDAKFRFTRARIKGCAACTDLAALADQIEEAVDASNDEIYCSTDGTPFGGDDTGQIPVDAPRGPMTRCANGLAAGVNRLLRAFVRCHVRWASQRLPDGVDEELCELVAKGDFRSRANTATCDPCVDLGTLADSVESTFDGTTPLVYCASPSGAFIGDAFAY